MSCSFHSPDFSLVQFHFGIYKIPFTTSNDSASPTLFVLRGLPELLVLLNLSVASFFLRMCQISDLVTPDIFVLFLFFFCLFFLISLIGLFVI